MLRRATAPMRCSQLSRRSSISLSARVSRRLSRRGRPGCSSQPQSTGHLLDDEPWFGERRELDQPHPVRVDAREIPGYLQGQSGLARSSGTGQGKESRRSERPLDLEYLPPASHEAGSRFGQVVPAEVGYFLVRGAGERRWPRWKHACGYLVAQSAGRGAGLRTELLGEDLESCSYRESASCRLPEYA